MGWNKYNNPAEDEGKVSDWNAAAYKMKRLDKEFSELQEININPKAFNEAYGLPNYEVRFKRLQNQNFEVDSKLSVDEKKEINNLRNKIQVCLNEFTIDKKLKSKRKNGNKIKKDIIIYNILNELLNEYERMIRKLIDLHGMDTSYDDFDGGL